MLEVAGVEGGGADGSAAADREAFLTANLLKIPEGGWLPLTIGGMIA